MLRVMVAAGLILSSLTASAEPASALDDDDGYRSLGNIMLVPGISIGTTAFPQLVVDEQAGRALVTGAGQLKLLSLDRLETLATIEGVADRVRVRTSGDSAFFVSDSSDSIVEMSLSDGRLVNQWAVELNYLMSIDVSPEFVWFTGYTEDNHVRLRRVERSTNSIVEIATTEELSQFAYVRVNPVNHDEIFLSTRAWRNVLYRYEMVGDLPIKRAENRAVAWTTASDFEVSEDGSTLVAIAGSAPDHIFELDAVTLQRVIVVYGNDSPSTRVVSGPAGSELLASVISEDGHHFLRLFNRGTPTPRSEFKTRRRAFDVAITSDEVFALVFDVGGHLRITAWTHDFEPIPRTVEVTVELHGTERYLDRGVSIVCSEHIETQARSTEPMTFELPLGATQCGVGSTSSGRVQMFVEVDGEWVHRVTRERNEHRSFIFDPREVDRVKITHQMLWPMTSPRLLANQTLLDVAGREAGPTEFSDLALAVRNNGLGNEALVVAIIDRDGADGSLRDPLARLYRAYFLRDPDPEGIEFWMAQLSGGRSLQSISDFFANSAEFELRYGSLEDDAFVDMVYRNVMTRSPDAAGRAFWVEEMDHELSRGELMAHFSDSPEFRSRQAPRLFVDYAVSTFLRRQATAQDHLTLGEQYRSGGRGAVVRQILESGEYRDRFWVLPLADDPA